MEGRVSKCVPIAERITEFGNLGNEALVLVDGRDILQYECEYPIVAYQCNRSLCYADVMPTLRLNSFIVYIVVSTGVDGKKYSVDSEGFEEEPTEFDTIAYYQDHFGIKHQIIQYDICEFLLNKPKLVVSEEGVLVFYTEDEILATTDCQQYVWVRWDGIIQNCKSIESIVAYKEYCKVTLIEGKDTYDDFGDISKKAPRHVLALNFEFKVADYNMINPIFTKKS